MSAPYFATAEQVNPKIQKSVVLCPNFRSRSLEANSELRENGADDATVMGIAGHVSRKMLEHYSHARLVLKRAAVERLGRAGRGTVGAQSNQFRLEMDSQTIENNGGRDRGRTGDLIVANDALSQLSYSPTSSDKSLTKDEKVSNTRAKLMSTKQYPNVRPPFRVCC